MATRAPRKTPARGTRAAASPAAPPAGGSADLLKAGLKAVTGRHPLFEALLGLDAAQASKRKELFRLPTFEDLFDERVARALARLGAVQEIEDVRTQLAAIDKRLQRLERLLAPEPRAKRPKR